ncbi:MAG: DUF262 domain-containing protein [Thermoguttaceae bacterium]
MSYQTPLTINKIVTDIYERRYLLPSIQREFVWKPEQIAKLFDSIMQGYPISTFLFWDIPQEKATKFTFYEFLREYHERDNNHTIQSDIRGGNGVRAVLDGQQRLTALYMALKGSYSSRQRYGRDNNPSAFPKKRLYLNLLGIPCDDEELGCMYEFEFLTAEESQKRDDAHWWFPVGDVLDIKDTDNVIDYLNENNLCESKTASARLSRLYDVIHNKSIISYYLEERDDLNKVLDIFIRVNSGGTALSYSDLLFSFTMAQWEKRNAKDDVDGLLKDINVIGRGFNFNRDTVLKACLVLCDFPDIRFHVDSFTKDKVLEIERQWEQIAQSIRDAVEVIASFGFNRDNLSAHNAMIPIAYYLKSIGLPNSFETSEKYRDARKNIKLWLVSVLLKRVFSYTPDGFLKPMRDIIKNNTSGSFPTQKIADHFKTNRSLLFTDDDLDSLIDSKYGSGSTLLILSLLYPWFDLSHGVHLDHAFPKSCFTRTMLQKKEVPVEKIESFIASCNNLGNLQLLEAIPNIQKSDMDFEQWLTEGRSEEEIKALKERHFIPNVDLSFPNFDEFLKEREKLLRKCLKQELLMQ